MAGENQIIGLTVLLLGIVVVWLVATRTKRGRSTTKRAAKRLDVGRDLAAAAPRAPRAPAFRRPRLQGKGPSAVAVMAALALIGVFVLGSVVVGGGLQGPAGPRGRPGTDGGGGGAGAGTPGADGADGFTALIETADESPGANCAAGGERVETGTDDGAAGGTPRNGLLEPGETTGLFYACDGEDGGAGADGFNAIVKVTTESPGVNCPAGGQSFEAGMDNGDGGGTARNGVLEAGERDVGPVYACNGAAGATGAAGADGFNSIVKMTAESPGANCVAGGQKFESGLDNGDGGGTARNGVLEAGERDVGPVYVCDGEDGATGSAGAAGRDSGLLYTYNTGTSGDPGSGKFGFDTTTLTAIATFRISETDGDGNGISALIALWDDSTTTGARSTITVLGNGAPTRLLVFTITSAITDNGAYDSFSVTYVTHAGSHANNDIDKIKQSRTGDKGDTGSTGSAGSNGNGFTAVDSLTSAFTSTSTTGAEVTGLTNSVTSGIYVATFYLICRTAAVGTGIDFGVNFDSTQDVIVSQMSYQDTGSTASAGTADGTVSGDAGELIIAGAASVTETTTAPNLNVITGVASGGEDFIVIITVIFKPTATGELELWVATDVAASQVDVRIGSSVTIIKTG